MSAQHLVFPARARQRGLALVEVALLGVIVAILVGGILQGQSLVAGARVRSLVSLGERARSAALAFEDRYRAMPGDYANATQTIPGVSSNGNGNGRVEENATPSGPTGTPFESLLAWHHLSRSGFMGEFYVFDPNNPSIGLPLNIWGGYADFAYDDRYGNPASPRIWRHSIKTGNFVPASVLSEVDRKLDDGNGLTGGFQFSNKAWGGDPPAAPPSPVSCVSAGGQWSQSMGIVNCGAAWLI